jgi:hypothetical protein
MGIDWFSMRPKPNVDVDEVRNLVEIQRTSFQKSGYSYSNWMPKYDFESEHLFDEHKQQSLKSSEALESKLDIDLLSEDEKTVCFRVYPITGYSVFPIEWQQQAYRTILPSELPAQLTIWREHIAAIKRGEYQTYLKYRFLYETSLEQFQHWDELRFLVDKSLSRTNNWVRKPAFVEVQNQLLELPPPEIYPAPLWSYWYAWPHKVDELVEGHYLVVLHKVVMTLKNLLGLKDLAGLPLLYAGLPIILSNSVTGYSFGNSTRNGIRVYQRIGKSPIIIVIIFYLLLKPLSTWQMIFGSTSFLIGWKPVVRKEKDCFLVINVQINSRIASLKMDTIRYGLNYGFMNVIQLKMCQYYAKRHRISTLLLSLCE